MNAAIPKLAIFCAFIAISITMAGCVGGNPPSPTPTVTPVPTVVTPTSAPGGNHGTPTAPILPSGTPVPTTRPGNNNSTVTPVPSASPTPQPVYNATTSDWGSDKDTYNRGDTATGWVYITNTGNTPITEIDFTIVIKRTVMFVPVEKTYNYNATGLNIQPGMKQKVQFSQTIPAEYSGISTAGDYQMTATAMLAGKNIGSYTRSIKVV